MKLIYDNSSLLSLKEFGIDIPLKDERSQKSYHYLIEKYGVEFIQGRSVAPNSIKQINQEDLERVHTKDFVANLMGDGLEQEIIRAYELIDQEGNYHRYNPTFAKRPLKDLFQTILRNASLTLNACEVALKTKDACFYFGGGMHHALSFQGQGFCLINDIVIALEKLKFNKKINTAVVIDVDAHKGDGTAELSQTRPWLDCLSIHMQDSWPMDKEYKKLMGDRYRSHLPSTIDIEMAQGEESAYLPRLEKGLKQLLEKKYDLAIVVQGADPFEFDELPSTSPLKLNLKQMLERDQLVFNLLREKNIPQAYVMGGGYGKETWRVYAQFLSWIFS